MANLGVIRHPAANPNPCTLINNDAGANALLKFAISTNPGMLPVGYWIMRGPVLMPNSLTTGAPSYAGSALPPPAVGAISMVAAYDPTPGGPIFTATLTLPAGVPCGSYIISYVVDAPLVDPNGHPIVLFQVHIIQEGALAEVTDCHFGSVSLFWSPMNLGKVTGTNYPLTLGYNVVVDNVVVASLGTTTFAYNLTGLSRCDTTNVVLLSKFNYFPQTPDEGNQPDGTRTIGVQSNALALTPCPSLIRDCDRGAGVFSAEQVCYDDLPLTAEIVPLPEGCV